MSSDLLHTHLALAGKRLIIIITVIVIILIINIVSGIIIITLRAESVTNNITAVVAYRPVAFFDAILPHDVQDAVADGVPIAPAPGEPCHRQAGEKPALGILA